MFSVGDQFITISLNSHPTTIISGPNGSGKTSLILDTLCLGLFNKSFRNINLPQIVNSVNGRECVVIVKFSVSGRKYEVKRGLAPKIFEIIVDGVPLEQDAAIADQQQYLEDHILKMSFKSFTQIVAVGMQGFMPFMRLKPPDRKAVIEDLLGVEIFSLMGSKLKFRFAELKKNEETMDGEIETAKHKIDMIEQFNKDSQKKNDEILQQLQSRIDVFKKKLADNIVLIEKSKGEIKRINDTFHPQDESSKLSSKIRKLTDLKSKLSVVYSKAKQEADFFLQHTNCPVCTQMIDPAMSARIVEEKVAKQKEIETALETLKQQTTEANATLVVMSAHCESIGKEQYKIDQLVRDNNQIAMSIKVAESDVTQTQNSKQENVGNLEEAQGELNRLISEKDKLTNLMHIHSLASDVLSEGGARTRVIGQYIPLLNGLINQNLNRLGLNISFSLNEKFEETIKSRFRDDFTYNSFSAGERLKIDVSILLAFRSVAERKNSISTSLLILDEVADGSMDSDAIESLAEIIAEVGNTTNVILISHRDQMKDRFSRCIHVEKQGDFTIVKSIEG